MNKLLLALGLVFIASTFVLAEEAVPGSGGDRKDPEMRGMMMKERIYKQLEVTEAQAKKLDAIEEEHNAKMSEAKKNSKIQMVELENLLETKASDDKLTAKMDQIQKSRDAMLDAVKERLDKSRAVLDVKQQAKATLMLGKMMEMGGMGMGGNRGGWEGKQDGPKDMKEKKKKKTVKSTDNE